ncbi:hypothetical protein [uncultured Nostoc sp.]
MFNYIDLLKIEAIATFPNSLKSSKSECFERIDFSPIIYNLSGNKYWLE